MLIAAGVGAWLLTRSDTSSTKPAAQASSSPSNEILKTLTAANNNQDEDAHGRINLSSCHAGTPSTVTCSMPDPRGDATTATFTTYAGLPALYRAYRQRLLALKDPREGHPPGFNYPAPRGCQRYQIPGESAWNHNRNHPLKYSPGMSMDPHLDVDNELAGRVFCRGGSQETIVWTQNEGGLLGVVSGPVHLVYSWWYLVHHSLAELGFGDTAAMKNHPCKPNPQMPGMC